MSSKDYFDQVATQWDAMRASFFSEAVREKALATADVRAGQIAADLGAGTGFITEALAARGVRVIAVDQSKTMLEQMRRNLAAKFPGARVEYRLGDADTLPIADSAVDYAFANMFLHHVETPANAIREMARILKPGGALVVTDLDEHNFEFLRTEQYDRWMGFKREDVRRWFEEAGLQQVRVDCVGEDCCADSACGSESARVSIFIASGQKAQRRGASHALST